MADDRLKHLLEIGRVIKDREKVGVAQRDVIKIDGKRYLYNPDNITRILARKVKAVYKELPTPTSILDDILQQDIEDGPSGMTKRQRIDRRKNAEIFQRFARRNADAFKKSERLAEIKV